MPYFELQYLWTWIKDKQIVMEGDDEAGVIIIADAEGIPVEIYGYERNEH
jgi:hypothetical protein